MPASTAAARRGPAPFLVAGATLVALVLAFARLGSRSFWLDEAYTWSTVDRSLGSLLRLTARDEGYQILHQFALWPWALVSQSEAWLRAPSALAFVATVPVIAWVGTRALGAPTGALAALLYALHGFAITLGQESRSYPFAALFAIAATGWLFEAQRVPSAGARRAWVASAALAIWSHGFAVLAVAPAALVATRAARVWRVSLTVAAALAVPPLLLPFLHTDAANDYAFLGEPSVRAAGDLVFATLGRAGPAAVGLAAAAALGAARWLRQPERRHVRSTLWASVLTPFVVLGGVSLVQPIWLDRYFAVCIPPLVLLAADAVMGLRAPWVRRAAAVALVATSLAGTVRAFDRRAVEDWRSTARYVVGSARPGDVVLFSVDEERVAFEYYVRDDDRREQLVPAWPAGPWGSFATGDQVPTPLTGTTAVAALTDLPDRPEPPKRVWIVVAKSPADRVARVVGDLADYRIDSTRSFTGVRVTLLVLRALPD